MIRNILLIFIILLFSNTIFAQKNSDDLCNRFYDEIRKNNNQLELFKNPIFEQEEERFGFTINSSYDSEKDSWIYTRDKENNISIFNTEYLSPSYDQLNRKDIIISINDNKTAKLDDEEIDQLIYDNNTINLKIKKNNLNLEEDSVDLNKAYFDQNTDVVPVFRIKSFKDIDIKNTEYTINYDLEYWWYDHRLIDLIKPLFELQEGTITSLIDEKKKELGDDFNENTFITGWWCELTLDEFYEEDLFLWHPEIEFINIVKNDLENRQIDIEFNYTAYGEDYEQFYITVKDDGIATFTTKFNLKAFPFDSHILDFTYADTKNGVSSINITYDAYATLPINENLKSKILEWNVPGDFAEYESIKYYDKYDYEYDGIKTFFKIERNSSYYLFKVIAPIILILIVCWSVFWLRTEQIESRLTVSIVCLLTLIAYNFVIDENIPKLAYLTAMDQIILSSYFFASVSTILSIYLASLNDKHDVRLIKFEKQIRLVAPIIYIAIVIVIMFANINKNPSALGQMKLIFG